MADLLIAGGAADGNLGWLASTASRLGWAVETLLVDADTPPGFAWDLATGRARLDGRPLEARAAFVRYDVFPQLKGGTAGAIAGAMAWYAAVTAFCDAEGVFTLNRGISPISASKPAMLRKAAACGLAIPATLVTNSEADARTFATGPGIAKPVAGGSYVVSLDEAIGGTKWESGRAPSPAIVQPMLAYPERRIYRVGAQFFVFDIASRTLDSRLDGDMQITSMGTETLDPAVLGGLVTLTDEIGCDFCAVDMKTDPGSGALLFLELNSSPMFLAYDKAGGGAMSEAMVRYLIGRGEPV